MALQISVILSTYQRPQHLQRSLASLALQREVDGQWEVIVTDDGSKDHTADAVRQFAATVNFPVTFTSHEHRGFRLARCRNEGVAASRSPYLLFSDGDCIFPPLHLAKHLHHRRPNVAWSGDCYHFDEESTATLTESHIATGAYLGWPADAEFRRIRWRRFKDRYYQAIAHPKKPKLTGSNIGIWRSDFERVNGFDEQFVGWGCEDDDLADRLRSSGVRIASSLLFTCVYHMWHPSHPSQSLRWKEGTNVRYLQRRDKPIRCVHGLTNRLRPAFDTQVVSFTENSSPCPATPSRRAAGSNCA